MGDQGRPLEMAIIGIVGKSTSEINPNTFGNMAHPISSYLAVLLII